MKFKEILEQYEVTDVEIAEALYAWLSQFNEEKDFMNALVEFLKSEEPICKQCMGTREVDEDGEPVPR